MQTEKMSQTIVLKGFFITLLVLSCLFIPQKSNAQGISAAQIVQMAKSGATAQASNALSSQTGLPSNTVTQFVQSLQSGKIDISSATSLVQSALGGQLNTSGLGNVTKMIQGLASGQATPTAISGLISQVAGGALPPEVGKALGAIGQLGNLANINSVADIFKNPAITKAIGDLAGKLGLPADAQKALQAISSITQLASNPQALLQNPAVTKALADAISKALPPQLAAALTKALGGDLAGAIAALLGVKPPTTPPTDPSNPPMKDQGSGLCPVQCSAPCGKCAPHINKNHQTIRAHVTAEFETYRQWLTSTYFIDHILPSMMLMASEFSTNMMNQVQIIGTFFDAKHQLETQRVFQTMSAKAHKDYQPSEGMCVIGTNVRSLAASERRANLGQVAFANRMMQRQLSSNENLAIEGIESDRWSRLDLMIKKFCRPTDGGVDKDGKTALELLCKDGGKNKKQINMDVDFTSAFENKLTLDVDFTKDGEGPATEDEENIFALSANLFANDIPRLIDKDLLVERGTNNPTGYADLYLDLRAVSAKRSVAQNSFAAITAMKSEGDDEVAPFLKAILAEAGINPADIEKRLGKKPSYFAQMEVLTKDIYQNPTFYANLYDKPVNIERKATALQAIELMQDRDIYKSLLRSEAVLATLVETLLRKQHASTTRKLDNVTAFGDGGTP